MREPRSARPFPPAGAGRAAAPWGLVGMLALVALGEWAFTRVEMDVIAPWHWDWRHAGKAAVSRAAKAEVICFGDSLMKFSVMPAVVEGRTGRSAYNLGVCLGQAPSSYFLLRRALAAGARPRAVLIDAVPIFLRQSPFEPEHLRQWPEMLTAAESLDLAWAARDAGFFAATTAAGLLPTFRARQEVRAAVLGAFRGEPSVLRFRAAQYQRNARVNRGANALPPAPPAGDLTACFSFVCGTFSCHPVNALYLDRFLALAAGRGIPVFWVVSPIANELQQVCDRTGFDAAQTAFLRSYQRRYPNLTVLDGRRGDYGRALYSADPIHLSRPGAVAFSDDLSSYLDRSLRGERLPRWVTLPAYRDRPAAVAVEDVNDSGLALSRKAGVRR